MSGEWYDWQWDESLFAGSAVHYDRGRLPNAPCLPASLAQAVGLDGTGRLLDVGCGPGTVTLVLSPYFDEVVGLDADADMLREAQRLAGERGVTNARWVQGRAEDLPADLGRFRVITFAASFHWMDRPRVARTVRTMLTRGGAVVHVDNRHQNGPNPGDDGLPSLPVKRIAELRRRYLGPDTRAGQGIRNTSPDDESVIFRGAGFDGPEVVTVPDGRTVVRTVDDLVAHTFSMHSTAPHLFGDQLAQFERDLRRVLAEESPPGAFSVRLPDNKLNVWRPRV